MKYEANEQGSLSLEKLQAGDRNEFARLVELYSDLIYRLAVKILGNSQDAEDALQETFLKAFRSIKDFKGLSSVTTWLYRIAVNEALMILRKAKPEQTRLELDDQDADEGVEPVQLADWEPVPEDKLLSAESMQVLNGLVQDLSPALRVVFLLRDIQELSVRETAEVLGVTEIVVKTRLSRARFQLRQGLSRYYSGQVLEGK